MIGRYTFPGPSETESPKAWKSMDSQLRDGWFLVTSAMGSSKTQLTLLTRVIPGLLQSAD